MTALSRSDDEEMTIDDLAQNSQLLWTLNKKSYPVTVQRVVSALMNTTTEHKYTFGLTLAYPCEIS